MELETEVKKTVEEILKIDDAALEKGFDNLKELFELSINYQQALDDKINYCRANNLTEDDLIEENLLAAETFTMELKDLSPIKQKFLGYILGTSIRINDEIIKRGLFPIVKVRVERLPHNEKLPAYAHEMGDSGLDVYLTEDTILLPKTVTIAKTGIKVAIPVGYELQVRPRSGMSIKFQNLFVANSPGTIDAGYREEVGIILKNIGDEAISLEKGTKIAQLVLTPVIKLEWVEVQDINEYPSDRKGGFGHTGDK